MAVESVSSDSIRQIARDVFGTGAEVTCVRAISPSKNHGITETPPSTRNLLYVVDIDGHPHSYVFRFSRIDDDVYEQEVRNYELLARETNVRVPTIYRLDTSRKIVPTAYMVMDYLRGKLWNYVAHPSNPNTDASDKAAVSEAVGRYYAQVHSITRDADEPGSETRTLLYTIDRLESAVQQGNVDATPDQIDRCRQAIIDEPEFQVRTLSLCLADTEVHVSKQEAAWRLAFVCDAEWIEYRHRFADLSQMLAGPLPWWRVEVPGPHLDPREIAARPFFRGYDPERRIDYSELLRLSSFYQLGLWAYVAMTSQTPDKRSWIRQAKGPLIQELIRIVAGQSKRERRYAPTP